jgi:hypothetical protein
MKRGPNPGDKPKGVAALHEMLAVLNEKVELLSKESQKEFSKGRRIRLNVLIILNVELRNFVELNMIKKVEAMGNNGWN